MNAGPMETTMRSPLRWAQAFLLFLMPSMLYATNIIPIDTPMLGMPCTRTGRESLSPVAAEVLSRIENSPETLADSPVPLSKILSTCNRFDSIAIDGPNIFRSASALIAEADHEVDIALFHLYARTNGADEIGTGLIAAQARRTPTSPLLVRIVVDDVTGDDTLFGLPSAGIGELYTSVQDWMGRGLDLSRVRIELATSPRLTGVSSNLHDKIIIVDGRSVLVTGSQPQKESDAYTPLYASGWHDSGYFFQGDVAQSALAAFEHTWYGDAIPWVCGGNPLLGTCVQRVPYPAPSRDWMLPFGTQQPGDIPILAVGRRKGGQFDNNTHNPQDIAWLTVLDHATTQVSVESPNINDDAFRAAVVRAVGRGVTVRLITSLGFNDRSADLPTQGGDNMEVVGNLRKEIRATYPWYQDRFQLRWYSHDGHDPVLRNGNFASHTKYMTADSSVAVVGSGNMDTAAWNMSHEFNVLIDDAPVTATLDQSLFEPDWSRAIGSYLELYEGNSGTQDVVCPIAVTTQMSIPFGDPINGYDYQCDNDEARSMLLHDVPAGKVFRFYDDAYHAWSDDDWTEVYVKRAISRKYLDSFESTFEDDDVKVVYHRNNGLDGKISAADISNYRLGPVVDLYEGNSATQNLVCSNPLSTNLATTFNFQSDPYCNNDEARSLVLYDWPADKALFFYDDPSGSRSDDYTVIIPKHALNRTVVSSFESSYETADVKVCATHFNGIDGKVSRMRFGSVTEAQSYCASGGGGGSAPPTAPKPF
jgi:phosphatidylserine/phosphatidylglycerophosphate/cardiolipin synthase-like enzyme